MPEEKKTSVWVYVGVGCAIVVVLAVIVAASLAYVGYRAFKQIEREMTDPAARAEKARLVLGCEEFPAGYHPAFTLSIPILLNMAILSDKEGVPSGAHELFGHRGFIYIRTIQTQDHERMRDYFEGRRDKPRLPRESRIEFDLSDPIGRGTITRHDLDLEYVAHRGWLRIDREDRGSPETGRIEGILSFMNLDCPGDDKVRLGVWFGPEPAGAGETGLTGTPADELAIGDFMSHFSPCSY
jgi:hypothetical protein